MPDTFVKPIFKRPESVLVVIHTAELEVLMLERADRPGYWQSVTGSRDSADETWTETAVREVREETGIIVERREPPEAGVPASVPAVSLHDWGHEERYEIFAHWRHRYAPGVTHNTEHWFRLVVPRDIPVTIAPREHTAWVWLPWREAAERCFSPSNRDAILKLPELVGAGAAV
ncbi:dihydroneopterin triphosphate diphosphatase [Derxia gummosa]|uniref:Dihydroneopterin triphosphate diphosphatase n=1 Tax=Derxia gummosa DSM 723 TaxID=1121388 RepID=A0A8B6X0R1_9BURK|nr:dihydroneopterin triphosphate diphosphatase [Derxia gummosa]